MAAERELSYGAVSINHSGVLGVGSYGKVCKAKCGKLPCAAKLLHDTMFETGDPGIYKFAERFEQECQFMSMIKHPNIVQYLGTVRDPLSRRLVLLMELMNKSLTSFLETSIDPLPHHLQLNICHDVALALSYLHSNAIIHRDLSSNNVLLIGEGSRAKVTDFGMSKLMDINTEMNPRLTQTLCPGATVYMPPEALTTPPRYSSKLDCFSHGVLTIQIITRNYPAPDDEYLLEVRRRKDDIDLIERDDPLLPTALDCLKNTEADRPHADEICDRLAALKMEGRYTHSAQQATNQASLVERLLRQKDQTIQRERQAHKNHIEELCRMRKADQKPSVTTQPQQKKQGTDEEDQEMPEIKAVPSEDTESAPFKLTWRKGTSSPQWFASGYGTAVTHGNTAYFTHENDIYSFVVTDGKWTKLKSCRNLEDFSLAVVNETLTTIGGRNSHTQNDSNIQFYARFESVEASFAFHANKTKTACSGCYLHPFDSGWGRKIRSN